MVYKDVLVSGIQPSNSVIQIFIYKYKENITDLEPDILECEVKWALGSITTNKASGGDRIPGELFQILKHDAVKVLHSICQHISLVAVCIVIRLEIKILGVEDFDDVLAHILLVNLTVSLIKF